MKKNIFKKMLKSYVNSMNNYGEAMSASYSEIGKTH